MERDEAAPALEIMLKKVVDEAVLPLHRRMDQMKFEMHQEFGQVHTENRDTRTEVRELRERYERELPELILNVHQLNDVVTQLIPLRGQVADIQKDVVELKSMLEAHINNPNAHAA